MQKSQSVSFTFKIFSPKTYAVSQADDKILKIWYIKTSIDCFNSLKLQTHGDLKNPYQAPQFYFRYSMI